jgi:hypothetical protein
MKLTRVVLISLGCVSGAIGFGLVANAAIDLVMPAPKPAARQQAAVQPPVQAPQPAPVETAQTGGGFALASATSTPVEISPVRVKTIPVREDRLADLAAERAATDRPAAPVPFPRRRPASAQAHTMAMAPDSTASIAGQPGSIAISAATSKPAYDGDPLSAAGIDRMKTALALTAEQEEFWPAIAAELRTIGKMMPKNGQKGQATKIDDETIKRLYWAASPLIARLSYEQKLKAKQMARLMGLTQVAEAL